MRLTAALCVLIAGTWPVVAAADRSVVVADLQTDPRPDHDDLANELTSALRAAVADRADAWLVDDRIPAEVGGCFIDDYLCVGEVLEPISASVALVGSVELDPRDAAFARVTVYAYRTDRHLPRASVQQRVALVVADDAERLARISRRMVAELLAPVPQPPPAPAQPERFSPQDTLGIGLLVSGGAMLLGAGGIALYLDALERDGAYTRYREGAGAGVSDVCVQADRGVIFTDRLDLARVQEICSENDVLGPIWWALVGAGTITAGWGAARLLLGTNDEQQVRVAPAVGRSRVSVDASVRF